jgi:hypothetical protein
MSAEFTPLPSAMQMVEAGNQDPEIKRWATTERRRLRAESVAEQAFATLWSRYGTGDDDERDLVWRWREAFSWINAGLRVYPPSKWSAERMADGFDADRLLPDDEQG